MNTPTNPSSTTLPPGWTRHIAPSGHYYYFNKATKESTYERPRLPISLSPPASARPFSPPPSQFAQPSISTHQQHHQAPQRPKSEHADWQAAYAPGFQQQQQREGQRRHRKSRKREVPKLLRPLSLEPWVLVVTNLGRPFVHNVRERVSLWLPPPEVQAVVDTIPTDELIMMVARCRGFKGGRDGARKLVRNVNVDSQKGAQIPVGSHKGESTDDQHYYDDGDLDDAALLAEAENAATVTTGIIRQRNRSPSGSEEQESKDESDDGTESTSEEGQDEWDEGPVEFNEDDIEWQIQAMMEEHPELLGGDDAENDDAIPYEDRVETFRELLVDANVNPYSPWDAAMRKIANDQRYIALETLSERKAAFEDWSKERISELKIQKANEPKFDPKEQFLDLLRQYATPKLFYQEFKRKYRKEPIFKETSLTDGEKEKIYRDYVKKK
ncbi:uncharacterized protein V1513DRAFT_435075 [Lipomyces chichibuensis]|uniref:uncharacterized protein n=1 Tax=Lipomyces chichibuensis TaxID=1546026 RepID=UPI0033440636